MTVPTLEQTRAVLAKRSLARFIELTTKADNGKPFILDDWQRNHFIPLLGLNDVGVRIRFHAPPQRGKSIILSKRFPIWKLISNPMARIVIVTYNEDFARRFYDAITSSMVEIRRHFPEFDLKGNMSTGLVTPDRAKLSDGTSSIVFTTIGIGFTGLGCDDCFVAGTKVSMSDGIMDIEDIEPGMTVKGYNIDNGHVENRTVIATKSTIKRDLVSVEFESGRKFVCTTNHPIFIDGSGYKEAGSANPGDCVLSLYGLRDNDKPASVRASEVPEAWSNGVILQPSMQSNVSGNDSGCQVPGLWEGDTESEGEAVLFQGVCAKHGKTEAKELPGVHGVLSAEDSINGVLLEQLRGQCALYTNEGRREFKVQGRSKLREVVPSYATSDNRAGIELLCRMQCGVLCQANETQDKYDSDKPSYSPHRRVQKEQLGRELSASLREVPCSLSHEVWRDTIVKIERIHVDGEQVYDIQVEGTNNFFAEGILVHNCIIDDPYRGLEDATSASYRETVESFFVNKLMSRINSETNIYLMYHAWAVGDIGDYAVKKYDFKPVRFPEIADGGLDDPTGRSPGEFLSPRMNEGLTLSLRDSDPKMFASMFQGIPISEGERLFEPWMFEDRIIEPYQCPKLTKWYRGVDTATKDKQSADDSATAKIAYDQAGNCFIRMTMTRKVNPAHLNEWMESLIVGDLTTMTIVEEHNAGYGVIAYFQRLPAYRQLVKGQQITAAQGGKRQRALVLADLARQRKVFIVKECEWEKLLDQLYAFTGTVPGEKDDLIDAITVVQTFIKEQKSDYEPILAVNPYNPMNSPSARRLVELKARER